MLLNLMEMAKAEKVEFNSIRDWPDLVFDKADKNRLSSIPFFTEILDSSIKINIESNSAARDDNICIIPSQYLLFAIKIKSIAKNLYSYISILDSVRSEVDKLELKRILETDDTSVTFLNDLDPYSKTLVWKPYNNDDARFGAKNLINKPNGTVKLRSNVDFFGSILLKVLSIPDESSSIIGKVIFNLCANPDVYDFLEKKYYHKLSFVRKSDQVRKIAEKTFRYFYDFDQLTQFADLESFSQSNAPTPFNSNSLFRISPVPLTEADLTSANTLRFFVEPLCFISASGLYVYLTTQWADTEEGILTFVKLKTIIERSYPDFVLIKESDQYILRSKLVSTNDLEALSGGENRIFYGAPGVGKSYKIDQVCTAENCIRTVFHPDSQYSDFTGCLKPAMDDGDITYSFRPGPFTLALVKAATNPEKMIYLIIEEINRASAPAVFGELFQLLDRVLTGQSSYSVTLSDPDMIAFIQDNAPNLLTGNNIKLPSNLSLLATMNSSDQAVMPMDTAFKRRWKFEYVPIDFSSCPEGIIRIPIGDTNLINVSWRDLAESINSLLEGEDIPEDRLLGPWFLNQSELIDAEASSSALKGKLLLYLWDDVLRHSDKTLIFADGISTYGGLMKRIALGEKIFSPDLEYLLLDKHSQHNEVITDQLPDDSEVAIQETTRED